MPNLYIKDLEYQTSTVKIKVITKKKITKTTQFKTLKKNFDKITTKKLATKPHRIVENTTTKKTPNISLLKELKRRLNETQKKSLDNAEDLTLNLSGVETILIDENEDFDYETFKKSSTKPKDDEETKNDDDDDNESDDEENEEDEDNDELTDKDEENSDANDEEDNGENENEYDDEEDDEDDNDAEKENEDNDNDDSDDDESDYLKNPNNDDNSLVLPHHIYSKLTTTVPKSEGNSYMERLLYYFKEYTNKYLRSRGGCRLAIGRKIIKNN